jgi:hypothetical protein
VRDPSDPANTWYAATDHGVYQTTDGGAAWSDVTVSHGLPNVEVSQLVFLDSETGGRHLYAGTYGRGIWRMTLESSSKLEDFTIQPGIIASTDVAVGEVTLASPAPEGGALITLSADDNFVDFPESVLVAEGELSASFNIVPNEDSLGESRTTVITAAYGLNSLTAQVTVKNLSILSASFSPLTVLGGTSSTLTIELNGPAPAGGVGIELIASSGIVTVPGNLFIAEGETVIEFSVPIGATNTKQRVSVEVKSGLNSRIAYLYVLPGGGS